MGNEETITFSINFVRGLHLSTSLFGALFLILVWLRFRRKENLHNQDWGFVLIAFALFTWVAMDLFKILNGIPAYILTHESRLLSVLNNAFIIAALPFFDYGFERIKEKFPLFRNGITWAFSVVLSNLLLVMFYPVFGDSSNDFMKDIIVYIDVMYSTIALALLGYAVTIAFYKRNYGWPFVSISIFISGLIVITQFDFLPSRVNEQENMSIFLMTASHFALITLLLVLAQSWVVEENELKYKTALNKNILEVDALKSELKGIKEIQALDRKNGVAFQSNVYTDTHLKFYKEETALIVELTVLRKGIIKEKFFSTQKREYKDLLKFAVYKKAGIEIKAFSGMHRDFGGDIYKSVSDIRKKFLNPILEESGMEVFSTNELIVQKIKGTGIYELDCMPEFIEIDQDSLKKLIELEKIMKPLEGLEVV